MVQGRGAKEGTEDEGEGEEWTYSFLLRSSTSLFPVGARDSSLITVSFCLRRGKRDGGEKSEEEGEGRMVRTL